MPEEKEMISREGELFQDIQKNGDTIIHKGIRYPVTVSVGVLFLVFFGFLALFRVPIQLVPDISRPVVKVTTLWPGANPQEVEREIVEKQEDQLKSLEGLLSLDSESLENMADITMEFAPGTNLDATILKVNNKLSQVPSYPDGAEKPVITTGGARQNAQGWFILRPRNEDSKINIRHFGEFAEDEIKSRFERIPGVSASNVFGGQERQILITFSPEKIAERSLTIIEIAQKIKLANLDYSAGKIDEGKRKYAVRTLGAFKSVKEIREILLREDNLGRVYLKDIATVTESYKDRTVCVRHKGEPSIAINFQKKIGGNVLEVMDGIKKAVKELNEGILARNGLKLVQVYDTTLYIRSSLKMVQQNILLGGCLAIFILVIFLRAFIPTIIVALAIPISGVGTFLALFILGRNINVVSLAGLSFAVGMLLDNSIVVMENIFTLLQEGKSPVNAAVEGTMQVWGAILASTLTTVAVFLPILFIEAEVAQLFRDIALAISCAVSLSLLVSVIVIPTMSARWLQVNSGAGKDQLKDTWFYRWVKGFTRWLNSSVLRRVFTIIFLTCIAFWGIYLLVPEADYLPAGNRDLVFCILVPPPGYNIDELERVGKKLEKDFQPLWTGKDKTINDFFFVAFGRMAFMGVQAADPMGVRKLIPSIQKILNKIPGMIAIAVQIGLFDQGIAGGRNIDLRIQGPDLERLFPIAQRTFFSILTNLKGVQARPEPGLELGQPELRMHPNRKRLAEVGLNVTEFGRIIDILVDGATVSEMTMADGKQIDIVLRGEPERVMHTQDLANLPIFLPNTGILPLQSLGDARIEMGTSQILRSERVRKVSIKISLPNTITLEEAMKIIKEKVVGPMEKDGTLKEPYFTYLKGTADKLETTRNVLQGNFLIAIVVVFLLMSSLFESFLYPMIILFSVPMAGLGGFINLRLVNRFIENQPMDVLTMLGFVILVGVVVNNAILIVDRTLRNVREMGYSPLDASVEAVENRIRPIFMSTLTSVFGMSPLILMMGPGSELYRGIGSVVVGGLFCSTIFTLILIPCLLSLMLELRQRLFPGSRV
ncbi:efflux RND transporter permease subunit [Candidatus Riflebacteria bacterium]